MNSSQCVTKLKMLLRKNKSRRFSKLLIKMAPIEVKVLFTMCEKDPNGELSFDEFLSMCDKAENATKEEQVKAFFKTFDKDGSGALSRAELKQMMKDMGETVDKYKVDGFMMMLDSDGDDKISLDELMGLI